MRTARLKLDIPAIYHCTSRIIEDRRILDDSCKDFLLKNLHLWADFCGVELLAYCIMDNHYHILARVDPTQTVNPNELDRRFRLINSHLPRKLEQWERDFKKKDKNNLITLSSRMGDISLFLKEYKQAITPWINAYHDRRGPLWLNRFTSLVVEDVPEVRQTVASYIDLNPVRAQLEEKPQNYKWSTSGQTSSTEHSSILQAHLSNPESRLLKRIPAFTLGTILGSSRFVNDTSLKIDRPYKLNKRQYTIPVHGLNPDIFTTYSNPRS